MINHLNGDSPFRPQQPIPAEHFVGRKEHIEKMMIRGARGVIHGRPYSYFVQGEYGIGKSSLVKYVQWLAKSKYKLHPIYVSLGKAESLKDMSDSIVKAAIESGIKDPEQWI